jgi:hypothetical protein
MRFVAALLFLLAAGPAWSGWTFVSDDSSGSLYADFDAVRQSDELREVWTMYAEKARVDRASPATKALVLFDCGHKEYQTLFVASYSEEQATEAPRASGAEIYDDLSQPWLAIARDSTYERIFAEVCSHRQEHTAMIEHN